MGQWLDTWQGGGDRLWLSLLIDAMEEVARPEVRAERGEATILQELRAQLARPVSSYACTLSALSRRN